MYISRHTVRVPKTLHVQIKCGVNDAYGDVEDIVIVVSQIAADLKGLSML